MSRASVGAALSAIALFTVVAASPAVADDHRGGGDDSSTITYPLPGTSVFPEGVDTFGRYFYVTSTATGNVFRGRIHDPHSAELFLPGGQDGRATALGIEATDHLLLIAGGPTGTVFVYDRRSGDFVSSHKVPTGTPAVLNDLAVAPNGDVYVTDSQTDIVYRIDEGDVEDSTPLRVSTKLADFDPVGAFNANGIVSARGGRYLIVVETDTGRLFRISTRGASVAPIDLAGATVTGGDGLEIKDRTLYVVRGTAGVITKVRLNDSFTSGRVVSETTDPTFRFATTTALDRGRLLVVNSQFDKQVPGAVPEEPFTVSSIPRP
jgi:Cu-Zn family superoxide dismutase